MPAAISRSRAASLPTNPISLDGSSLGELNSCGVGEIASPAGINRFGAAEPLSETPAMHIDDLVPVSELRAAIRDGLVRERCHGGLRILNYTKKCQADAAWSHVTMTCRGLIADHEGRVVARPFPKFFYPGEPAAPALPDPSDGRWEMRACEKLDGVLGVGYVAPDGSSRVSTRGSLTSEQGVEANRILAERYPGARFPRGITPLFEIISPACRIIVDYGGRRDLVLVAAIDIETGADVALGDLASRGFNWPGPQAKVHHLSLADAVAETKQGTRGRESEGFVVCFDPVDGSEPSLRFKLKHADYLRMHAARFHLSSRRVWELAAADALTAAGITNSAALVKALRVSPETAAEFADADGGLVDALLDLLDDELRAEAQQLAARLAADADAQLELYYQLMAGELASLVDDPRGFALAAQQAAARNGISPHPLYKLRPGRFVDALAHIWSDLRDTTDADPIRESLPEANAE